MNTYREAQGIFEQKGGNKVLLQTAIENQYVTEVSKFIIDRMTNDSFIVNNYVNYNNCSSITSFNQTLYKDLNLTDIQIICESISKNYQANRESLRQSIKKSIKDGMLSTLSGEVINPIANHAAYYVFDNVKNWLKEHLKKPEKPENQVTKLSSDKKDSEEAYEDGLYLKPLRDAKGKPILLAYNGDDWPALINEKKYSNLANMLEVLEGRVPEIYIDDNGIPTIGVGCSLVRIAGERWYVLSDSELATRNLDFSSEIKSTLSKIANRLNNKVAPEKIQKEFGLPKNEGIRKLKGSHYKIDSTHIDSILNFEINDHTNRAMRPFTKEQWSSFTDQQKDAIISRTYNVGNARALKEAYNKNGINGIYDELNNAKGHRAAAEARLFKNGAFCDPNKYCVTKEDKTFSGVAKKLGIPETKLKKLNPQIQDFNVIHKLQEINIPDKIMPTDSQKKLKSVNFETKVVV